MQGIVTKYHGPTDTRGARISATSAGGVRIYRPLDYAVDADANHREAARQLCVKLGWSGQMIGGTIPGGGMAWVFADVLDADSTFTVRDEEG